MDRRRIDELDGYRVIMVFLVSWFHIWQQSWLTPRIGSVSLDFLVRAGYMPVDATILLSGFLLFLPYVEARLAGKPEPGTGEFYLRRVARTWPSLALVTLLMLFCSALPKGFYRDAGTMAGDIAAHLTYTFPFFERFYQRTALGGASWTIAVEMHFYLLFPLLARGTKRHAGAVLCGMAALAAYFRGWCIWAMESYSMVVNQMISFLDVYALGMACALVYPRLRDWVQKLDGRKAGWAACGATGLLAAGIWGFCAVLRRQAQSAGYDMIQAGQMMRRPLFALTCAAILLALPFCIRPVRFLFGNRLMRFLAGISMNYYLLHQNIAVLLKEHGIPYSAEEMPNQAGDLAWQIKYTALCFGLSLLAAIVVTYLVEKPCSRLMLRLRSKLRAEKTGG